MQGRIKLAVASAAVAAMALMVAPASATHVQCGDTINTSTTLDSDVVCPDETFQPHGLLIGADNVTLRLNGYAIRAGTAGGSQGIAAQQSLSGVRIKRGAVHGFHNGVELAVDDGTVFRVTVSGTELVGINLVGDRNSVLRSTVPDAHEFGKGILLIGNDAYAWGNVVTGGEEGITARGERPRLVYNQVDCGASSYSGVVADGYTTSAVLNRNTVSGCQAGVVAEALNIEVGGARVALNQTTGGTFGVRVSDPFARVGNNVAREATDTGIMLDQPGTTVRNNGAYDNGKFGIYGPPGTVDGGGNLASGNGDGTAPECVEVECGVP